MGFVTHSLVIYSVKKHIKDFSLYLMGKHLIVLWSFEDERQRLRLGNGLGKRQKKTEDESFSEEWIICMVQWTIVLQKE